MGRTGGDVQLRQSRRRDGRRNDISRNRGKAHAQDHTGDHGEYQRKEDAGFAKGNNRVGHGQAEPGLGTYADDDADTGAGNGYRYSLLGSVCQRVQQILEGHPGLFPDE